MYTPNNIRFRIVSSCAIAQFKQDQAFDFNELINNDAYSFSPEARETLLLNYELWFKFIGRLEKMMIRTMHSNDAIGELVVAMDALAKDTLTELQDVIQTHPTIFNTESPTTALIMKAHRPFIEHIFDTIGKSRDLSMYLAFPRIVNAISNCLHNLLFILHEVENLKKAQGENFLSMTQEIFEIWGVTGVCPLQTRAELYSKAFSVNEFFIKNYSGRQVEPLCFELMGQVGVTIKGINDHDNFDHHNAHCEIAV